MNKRRRRRGEGKVGDQGGRKGGWWSPLKSKTTKIKVEQQ